MARPPRHIGRADAPPADSRFRRQAKSIGFGAGGAVGRLLEAQLVSSFWKRSRSSAMSIDSGVVPMMGTPLASSARASFSGVWPPYWTITPTGLSTATISSTSSRVSGSK